MYRHIALWMVFFLFMAGSVWGAWNVEVGVQPTHTTKATMVTAHITTDGNKPVTKERCSQVSVIGEYKGNTKGLTNLNASSNIWYERIAFTGNGTVTVTASGACPNSADEGVSTSSEIKSGSNTHTTAIRNNFSQNQPRGGTIPLEIAVNTANPGTNFDPGLQLNYTLLGPNNTLPSGVITPNAYHNASNTYVKNITLPDQSGTHLLWVSSQTSNAEVPNGDAAVLEMAPNLEGNMEITSNDDACNDDLSTCEISAELNITVTETVGEANNGTLLVKNAQTDAIISRKNLTERSNKTWGANITAPTNVSTVQLEAVLENEITDARITNTIQLVPFRVNFLTRTSVSPGETIPIRMELYQPFTNTVLSKSAITEMNVSIVNQSADNTTERYTLDDVTFSQDLFSVDHAVPQEVKGGQWTITASIKDQYGNVNKANTSFTVSGHTQSGTVQISPQSMSRSFNATGQFNQTLQLNNTGTSTLAVHLFTTGNISEILSGEGLVHSKGDRDKLFLLKDDAVQNKELVFNVTENSAPSYSGEIVVRVLADLDDQTEEFRATIPVTALPQLRLQNGSIAITPKHMNLSISEQTTLSHNITVLNLGKNNTSVSLSPTDNVADILTVQQNTVTVTPNEEQTIPLTISVQETTPNAWYTGAIKASTNNASIEFPITVLVDKGKTQANLSVQITNRDLGTVVKGTTITRQVQLHNAGTVPISNLQATPPGQNPSLVQLQNISGVTLSPGNTTTKLLHFDTTDMQSQSFPNAQIVFSGSNEASGSVTVQITVVKNYSKNFNQLENTVSDLQSQAQTSGANMSDQITQLQTLIQNGKESFSQRQYEATSSAYTEAKNLKQSIETQLEQAANNNATSPTPSNGGNEGGGGPPVILFLVIFVVLLAIGVVLYLSIIPE